jgi:hypothetical protein
LILKAFFFRRRKLIDSTGLPNLRMVPTGSLIPHEDFDPQRVEILVQRIRQEDRLKNPPITAAIPETDLFVILDGTNRAQAFAQLKIPHIVAQVVSYGDTGVILDTWNHIVAGMDPTEFERSLSEIAGLRLYPSTLEEAREALVMEQATAFIVSERGVHKVCSASGCHRRDLNLLNDIVRAYRGKASVYPASNDSWERQAPYYPDITALVIFPRISPSDILASTRQGEKLPYGVTRHVIPNRALNINIPLSILSAGWGFRRKEEWLQNWLMERMAASAIRFYAESTFSFDD